jgi:ClpP class serine protease
MSGGTLIALAADEIVMCRHAVLGPVDPQLGQAPAASILQVLAKKPIAEIDDQTLILADQAEKAIRQVRESVLEFLQDRYPAEQAARLAGLLSEGTWTHDYPITVTKAQELGLAVSCAMPKEVLQLMQLFPQPAQHRIPSVEYLPVPRHARDTPGQRWR